MDKMDWTGSFRDCVRIAWEKGAKRGQEFKTMRHAIIAELKRLGYSPSEIKDKLAEWNQRCEKVLSPGEARRQLLNYVDWATKQKTCLTGCKSLADFCVGKEKCRFSILQANANRQSVKTLPLDLKAVEKFLRERYPADWYLMMRILHALRRQQLEKGTGTVIYIGVRAIVSSIRDYDGHQCKPMSVLRRLRDLESEGILETVVKGRSGTFGGLANGYRFLGWKPP